jgi:hypothetical protein
MDALPFVDLVEADEIDLLLISQYVVILFRYMMSITFLTQLSL